MLEYVINTSLSLYLDFYIFFSIINIYICNVCIKFKITLKGYAAIVFIYIDSIMFKREE